MVDLRANRQARLPQAAPAANSRTITASENAPSPALMRQLLDEFGSQALPENLGGIEGAMNVVVQTERQRGREEVLNYLLNMQAQEL